MPLPESVLPPDVEPPVDVPPEAEPLEVTFFASASLAGSFMIWPGLSESSCFSLVKPLSFIMADFTL